MLHPLLVCWPHRRDADHTQASVGVYYAKAMHAAMAMLMGGSVRTFDNDLMRQVCMPAVTTSLCICTHLSARATLPRTTHTHTHTHTHARLPAAGVGAKADYAARGKLCGNVPRRHRDRHPLRLPYYYRRQNRERVVGLFQPASVCQRAGACFAAWDRHGCLRGDRRGLDQHPVREY